jgi:hypothetical protein
MMYVDLAAVQSSAKTENINFGFLRCSLKRYEAWNTKLTNVKTFDIRNKRIKPSIAGYFALFACLRVKPK